VRITFTKPRGDFPKVSPSNFMLSRPTRKGLFRSCPKCGQAEKRPSSSLRARVIHPPPIPITALSEVPAAKQACRVSKFSVDPRRFEQKRPKSHLHGHGARLCGRIRSSHHRRLQHRRHREVCGRNKYYYAKDDYVVQQ